MVAIVTKCLDILKEGEYMSTKSYTDEPSLYLIATPIGNMDDITYRAIETLKKVDVIFSEDTRVTQQLLNHFDIRKPLIASHQFNENSNKDKLLSCLQNGQNVGLVTDRGTPIISDPGYELTKTAIEHNYPVIAVPGATALICALITSGLAPNPFTFYGFLNSKTAKRKKELESIKHLNTTLIFYEAPHRIVETLNDILNVLGNRQCSISREITKKYEEVYRGSISDVLKEIQDAKGEMVIVVAGNKNAAMDLSELSIMEHINLYVSDGLDIKEAIKKVAKERHLNKNDVYQEYHVKNKGDL